MAYIKQKDNVNITSMCRIRNRTLPTKHIVPYILNPGSFFLASVSAWLSTNKARSRGLADFIVPFTSRIELGSLSEKTSEHYDHGVREYAATPAVITVSSLIAGWKTRDFKFDAFLRGEIHMLKVNVLQIICYHLCPPILHVLNSLLSIF